MSSESLEPPDRQEETSETPKSPQQHTSKLSSLYILQSVFHNKRCLAFIDSQGAGIFHGTEPE